MQQISIERQNGGFTFTHECNHCTREPCIEKVYAGPDARSRTIKGTYWTFFVPANLKPNT
jgi:hypothetical protein